MSLRDDNSLNFDGNTFNGDVILNIKQELTKGHIDQVLDALLDRISHQSPLYQELHQLKSSHVDNKFNRISKPNGLMIGF